IIAGEAVLVPVARNSDEVDSIYTLNETASTIWGALDGQRTLAEIIDLVVAEYEVTREQAEVDLYELVAQLSEVQAVVVEGAA
ncbi:MAG: PqqD family protein, partial [Chloroflexi bacterium]|nr:PqqD family protein [Chloroflexota bacterium]